jgi:hypothetical protein
MMKSTAIVLLAFAAGCSVCPPKIEPPSSSAASVGLYIAPLVDNDGKVSLAIRILNHTGSGSSIWVNSSMGRVGTAYGVVTPIVFDDRSADVSGFCTDDASLPPKPAYKVLRPGEWVETVVRPWCGVLDPNRVYVVQAQWDDSYPTIPLAPQGTQTFRGPLVSPAVRIDPSKLTTTPNWSAAGIQ